MATMLSIVLTDATADPATLHALLRGAAARTWNQLSVDGDTSTNDTVFVLASGRAGAVPAGGDADARRALGAAIEAVGRDLARQQAADGEGAKALITCQVTGATDDAAARAVARAVISSSLVKAAVHGRDPNWGRIAGAAGNARFADAAVLEASGVPRRRCGDASRHRGAARPVDAPDRDRGPPRLRRPGGRAGARRQGRRQRGDGRRRGPDPPRPRPRRGHRRGLRLRPDRGTSREREYTT